MSYIACINKKLMVGLFIGEIMKIKIKKLHPDAIIPKYANPGDSGFDLVALEQIILGPGETKLVPTGLSFEIEPGYELQVRPRSGLSLKTPLRVGNSPGTVDSSYRGQVCVIMWNSATFSWVIDKGDRIAQGVIQAVERVEFEETIELGSTERNTGGFGSTGK